MRRLDPFSEDAAACCDCPFENDQEGCFVEMGSCCPHKDDVPKREATEVAA